MANDLQIKLDAILADKNTNLLPENLKSGVTLLGVNGTYTGQDIDVYTQAVHTLYANTSDMVFEKHSFADMGLIFPDNITLAEDMNGQVPFSPYVTDSSHILDAGILVNESSNVVYPYFVGDKNCVYAFDKMLNFTTKIEGRAETNGYVYANGNFKLYGNGTQMIWISINSNITLDDYTSGNVLSLTLQNQGM